MKKLSLLLDDITIINFGLLFKLARRYTLHLVLALGLFLFLFFKFYYTQPIIFSTIIPMKVQTTQASAKDLVSGKGEAVASMSIGELTTTFSSFAFNKTFASFIIKEPYFSKMNFGSIALGGKITGSEISAKCKEEEACTLTSLAGYLGGFFSIEPGLTEDRFTITVNSLEHLTTLGLSNSLVKAIEQNRIAGKRYTVTKEIDSVNSLIAETRAYLQSQKGFETLEEDEKRLIIISDLKERMRILQSSLSNEIANSSALDARVVENQKVINESINNLSGSIHRDLDKKITDIKNNISTIANIPDNNKTAADNTILTQLKAELNYLTSLNKGQENLKSLASKDTFSDEQRAKENDFKFDYIVSKNKIKNLQSEYELIKTRLDSHQKNKTTRDAVVSKLKAEVEFLKNLESKQLSLKVTHATLSSDLQFESTNGNVAGFRRSSPMKIILFSFCFTLVIYMFTLVMRFLIDTRIYSKDDIALHLEQLEFFGEVPSFEL